MYSLLAYRWFKDSGPVWYLPLQLTLVQNNPLVPREKSVTEIKKNPHTPISGSWCGIRTTCFIWVRSITWITSFHLSGPVSVWVCLNIGSLCFFGGKRNNFSKRIQLNLLWTGIHTEIENTFCQLGKWLGYGQENFSRLYPSNLSVRKSLKHVLLGQAHAWLLSWGRMLPGIGLQVNTPFCMLISTWSLHEQTGVHDPYLENGTKYLRVRKWGVREGKERGRSNRLGTPPSPIW